MNTKQPHIETLQMTIGVAMAEEDSPKNIEIPLEIKLPNGRMMYPACVLGGLPFHGQQQIAERIAAAWNAFTGIATTEIHAHAPGAGGVEPLRKRECLHQICETAAPASDGEYPKLPERAAFEDWIKKDGGDLRMFGSGQNTHYCNSAVNNAWGGWKASAARVATTASAPVVLPEPVAAQSQFTDTPSDTWDSCSVEHARSFGGAGYEVRYLYTEQQVRAMLAAAPKPPAHEPLRCSCHTCWPIAADDPASTFMRLCPACGNKRCPKANDHRHACTGSNEPGQPGSAYQLTGGITSAQKGDAPK